MEDAINAGGHGITIIAETQDEKRDLAAYLNQHDPEMLAVFKAAGRAFGTMAFVIYETESPLPPSKD